jgi:hypothetical protein
VPHCRLYWKSQIEDGSFTEKTKRDCLLTKRVKRDALLTKSNPGAPACTGRRSTTLETQW